MDINKLKSFPPQTVKPEPGRLLLSEPFLNDGYFRRAVILITEHNKEGSVGFILNKPLDISLSDIVADAPKFDGMMLMGGPVGRDTLHFIHTLGHKISGSKKINDGVYWGGDFEVVKTLISEGKLYPDEIKFFVGYSGWSAKQLEMEVKKNSWFVLPSSAEYIMNQDTSHLWYRILRDMGEEYSAYANYPVDPILN